MKNKIISGVGIVALLGFFIIIISQKDSMNQYLSQLMREQVSDELQENESLLIDSLYNYAGNNEAYEMTFLEFGAESCISCRKMKTVMDKVKADYKNRVNVVFLNSMKKENQDLMNWFGVASIPTQILLDKQGKEYYRHSGYILFEDLWKQFKL